MTMLRVRDISMRFGGIVALDGVSLDLNRGEILGPVSYTHLTLPTICSV